MPTGPVYQPTTETYEQQSSSQAWNCPFSRFSRRLTNGINRILCFHLALCISGILVLLTGLSLVAAGSVKYSNATNDQNADISILIAGSVLLAVGILLAGVSGYIICKRGSSGKDAGNSGAAAALNTLNPSTDPLVAAVPTAPDDERTNLMDNKECLSSAEESDKMLDKRTCEA